MPDKYYIIEIKYHCIDMIGTNDTSNECLLLLPDYSLPLSYVNFCTNIINSWHAPRKN